MEAFYQNTPENTRLTHELFRVRENGRWTVVPAIEAATGRVWAALPRRFTPGWRAAARRMRRYSLCQLCSAHAKWVRLHAALRRQIVRWNQSTARGMRRECALAVLWCHMPISLRSAARNRIYKTPKGTVEKPKVILARIVFCSSFAVMTAWIMMVFFYLRMMNS